MRRSVRRRLLAVTSFSLLVVAGSCGDSGPRGPGTWTARVRSSTAPAGAVIVELQGSGIESVEGLGATSAYAAMTGRGTGSETWRVVLVTPSPGEMDFEVAVEDLGEGAPRAVVVSAVDGDNLPLGGLASFSVEMSR